VQTDRNDLHPWKDRSVSWPLSCNETSDNDSVSLVCTIVMSLVVSHEHRKLLTAEEFPHLRRRRCM